jgi:hypothetical protein
MILRKQILLRSRHGKDNGSTPNGGGFAATVHIRRALRLHPDRFADYERREQEFRAVYEDVAILKETRRGKAYPLPLAELRRRAEDAPPAA